jgi:hypothetical protein
MPFIMPDGRPLGAFLADTNLLTPGRKGSRRGTRREPKQGWSSSMRPSSAASRPPSDPSPAEEAELSALARVGQRRQRR